MIEWLKLNVEWIAALVSIGAIAVTAIHYINLRSQEIRQKRFEVYHSLIRDFVQPDQTTGATYLDRQIAVAFELRNFPEYYELSLRLLEGLLHSWKEHDSGSQRNRLLDEMKRTIEYIQKRRNQWHRPELEGGIN